ncbi:MAG: transporter substrate-binding domain-containing protein [Bacillota bacterium]
MKKYLVSILAACMLLFTLNAQFAFAEKTDQTEQVGSPPMYTEFDQLEGKIFGLLTGAPFENLIRSKVGLVKDFEYFNSVADEQLALEEKKIDAYMTSNAVAEWQVNQESRIAIFPKPFGTSSYGFAFKKGDPDCAVWQDALNNISDETKDELWKKWTGADDSKKTLPKQDWPGKNGTIKVAACDTIPPMSYGGEQDQIEGFDTELILMVAKEMDIHVKFVGMDFSAIMPYMQSGKAKFASGGIIVTDERQKTMDFANYYTAEFDVVVLADEDALKIGFWQGLKDSFKRTFITEKRYLMILSGLGVTVTISAAAGILGLLLAFGIVFLRHRNRKVFNKLIAVYSRLIAGIPAVVILMVLYYIIFGAVEMPAVIVAIIGFALIFGARAYDVIWSAVCTVDPGQREAALALGYSENLAFRDIILPQSKDFYRPILQAQFITLVKETSIVGYITALDLTRAGDLIRSRTMEAFFPLLAIALIYFLLTWFLGYLLKRIHVQGVKKRDKRIIKGVDQ